MRTKLLSVGIPLVILAFLAAVSVLSYPRLAVEHSDTCKSCHVNPTGGGARNEYGNYTTALNELTFPQTKAFVVKRYKKPRLAESLVFGFDTRHLVFQNGRLFRMQTDAYLTAEPIQHMYYHIRISETGISENYALLTFHDEKYWAKAGRFFPTFGLHNDDHTAYVRARTGIFPTEYLDGLSAGIEQYGINLSAEYLYQIPRSIYGLHAYRVGSMGPVGYLAGGSLRFSEKYGGSNGPFPNARALFGGLSYNRFTAMGEVDVNGQHGDTLISYGALYGRVQYGLWLVGEYSWFDGNRHLAGGVDEFLRFSAEIYPVAFFELRPSLTYYTQGYRTHQHDWFLLFHFGY